MIYLQNDTELQRVRFPRSRGDKAVGASCLLTLTGGVSGAVALETELTDSAEMDFYYQFDLQLPAGLADGEYGYELTRGGETLGTGLVTVGDYRRNLTEFDKKVRYGQYEI
jgi:hypothetical protein